MTAETKKENGKKKLLVLDDEQDVLILLKKVLKENALEADSHDGPILALENFKAGIYDFYWISKCKNGWLAYPRK